MKVLLIYPPYTHSNAYDSRAPSMALFYLAAMLEKGGHDVEIFDASLGPVGSEGKVYRYGLTDEDIVATLRKRRFDLVGMTCSFTARWRFVRKIAAQVKSLAPDVPVAIGGLFPTSDWEYCLQDCPQVDMILLGEAEQTFLQVVNNLAAGRSLAEAAVDVEGIAYRKDDQLYYQEKVSYNERLDVLPFPAWHLADLDGYFACQRRIFELPPPCLPILSSRSCPNHCSFCNMYITHGRRWRPRSAENVLAEIEYLQERFGVKRFYFIDDNFSLDLARAKAICQGILNRGWDIRYNFHNGLSIKTIDEELVQLMKLSGCSSVCLAIESGSERVRNQIYRKGLKTEQIERVFHWFKQEDIPTIGYFLVGAPGETRADFEASKLLVSRIPMSLVTVGIFTPYPRTELYDLCRAKGWLVDPAKDDENRVELFSSLVSTPDFSPEEVAHWQKELYLSFVRQQGLSLLKEWIRPGGVVNGDMIGKFVGMLKSRTAFWEALFK